MMRLCIRDNKFPSSSLYIRDWKRTHRKTPEPMPCQSTVLHYVRSGQSPRRVGEAGECSFEPRLKTCTIRNVRLHKHTTALSSMNETRFRLTENRTDLHQISESRSWHWAEDASHRGRSSPFLGWARATTSICPFYHHSPPCKPDDLSVVLWVVISFDQLA